MVDEYVVKEVRAAHRAEIARLRAELHNATTWAKQIMDNGQVVMRRDAETIARLRNILSKIVETDDGAALEMKALGLEPSAETMALTEEARAALAQK